MLAFKRTLTCTCIINSFTFQRKRISERTETMQIWISLPEGYDEFRCCKHEEWQFQLILTDSQQNLFVAEKVLFRL